MPKIQETSPVDIEIRKRLEEGMLAVSGRDIRGNDVEYNALLRLCGIANVHPLVNTYVEIDQAIQVTFNKWRDRAKLLGGSK